MEKFSMDFKYNDEDYKSVFDYGDYLRKIGMCMRDCDKKWEFVCRVDQTQNTLHMSSQTYARSLERTADDLGKHIMEHPYDTFMIEQKQEEHKNDTFGI